MAKQKNPLLSLEAHGSIGDALTYQGRGVTKVSRAKPRLPYFLTLPSQYQRWLYQDYAYRWRQQSSATQATYRSACVRYHLTGYQYWMKYMLTNLPDILGLWYLDQENKPTTPDASRNLHTGTVIGATPATGPISGCLSFDGINDYVTFGSPAVLDSPTELTIEAFVRFSTPQPSAWSAVISKHDSQYEILINQSGALWRARGGINIAGTYYRTWTAYRLSPNTWYHLAFTYPDRKVYIDGIDRTVLNNQTALPINPASNLTLATRSVVMDLPYAGLIDQPALWDRPLTQATILRHSERRWPSQ